MWNRIVWSGVALSDTEREEGSDGMALSGREGHKVDQVDGQVKSCLVKLSGLVKSCQVLSSYQVVLSCLTGCLVGRLAGCPVGHLAGCPSSSPERRG